MLWVIIKSASGTHNIWEIRKIVVVFFILLNALSEGMFISGYGYQMFTEIHHKAKMIQTYSL